MPPFDSVLQTERPFTLPMGLLDDQGTLHRDRAEVAVDVQPDEPAQRHLHGSHDDERETEDERHLRIRARGAPGQVAGAASYTIGLAAHRKRPACPSAFSQSPRPGTPATLTPRPDAPADAPSASSYRYASYLNPVECHFFPITEFVVNN